jgi:WD40 repeat protein
MRFAFWLGVLLLACCSARAEEPALAVQGGPRQTIRAAKVSPRGDLLATLDGSLLQLWTRDGGVLWSRSVTGDSHALAWSRDGKKLAVGFGGLAGFYVFKAGDSAGALELDARDGRALRTLLQGNNAAYEIAYLSDGRLATRSDGGNPFVWDETGQKSKLEEIYGHIFPSPASDAVAVLTTGIQLWDANLKTKLASLWQKGMPAQTLSWSPKGAQIAVANRERVQLWSAAQRALEREIVLPAPASPTSDDSIALAWTPDGKTLLVARTDFPDAKPDDPETGETRSGAPRLFLASINTATGALQTLRSGERRAITALDFWPDGTLVWGGADDDEPPYGDAELYFARVESDAVKAVWSAPQPLEAPRVAELSPDGRSLAVGGDDTAIRLWNLKSGRLEKTLKELSGQIVALSWSPSGKQIAALDYQSLFVFDIESGNGRTFKGTSYFVGQLPTISWSPDEKQIALSGADGTFTFDLPTAKRRELKNPDSAEEGMDSIFGPVRWTREGLETSGGLQLIDPKTGRTLRTLNATGVASERAHEQVRQFVWFNDGRKLLALGSHWEEHTTIKRWDVPGNRVERTLKTEFVPREFALAPDEKSFAVGGENGELALFDTQTFESIWQHDFLRRRRRLDFLLERGGSTPKPLRRVAVRQTQNNGL